MDISNRKKYISLLTVSLLCTFGITLLFYVQSVKVIDKTAHEKINSLLSSNAMMIENKVENTELLSHQLVNIITSTIPYDNVKNNPEAMEAYKKEIAPLIIQSIQSFDAKTGWVVFDTNKITNSGTISYSKVDQAYIREPEYDVRQSGYAQQEWWTVAEKNGTAWSTPYYWAPWDATIISFSEQVKVREQMIAMAGSELYFNDIAAQLSCVKLFQTGYITLLNAENMVLYDPNEKIIGQNYSTLDNNQYQLFVERIKTGKTTEIIDDIPNNKNNILAYIKLKNGWVLLTNLSKKEIYLELNQLNFVLVVIIMSLIAFAQISSKLLSKNA